MKKSALLIAILPILFYSNFLRAQQWHYYNPTAWFDINSIEILGPGLLVIGGGQETRDSIQIMFQSPDYGLTWYENSHDGLAPWNRSVAFSDSQKGYGVGYSGRIIRTDDAGLNWGYSVYPINRDLNKIVYTGNGTYYIAGGSKTNDSVQTILKSTNFGNSWNIVHDTLGPWLKSIAFISSLKGFAVGDNGTILSTTNGGNTWLNIAAPVQRDFNAITFVNADTGYIVGGIPSGLCKWTVLRTVNGGISWSVLSDYSGGILKDISFADAIVGYAVGDSATVLKTTDGGLNWTRIFIDSSLIGNESFNAVKFYDRNFGAIGGKAGLIYVYKNGSWPSAITSPANNITLVSATLNGTVNSNHHPANIEFEYGITSSYGNTIAAIPPSTSDTNNISVFANISGLTPSTSYHFRIKASNTMGTNFGNDMMFNTTMQGPLPSIITRQASNITLNSATLNGFVNPNHYQTDVSFEYGLANSYGNTITASPPVTNDTNGTAVSADLTGLNSDTYYHFRVKATSIAGTKYGDDLIFYTGFPEIPNFDFEVWNSTSIDFPDSWTEAMGDISRYSPACNGNYAVKIHNTAEGGISALTMGFVGDGVFGGVPFQARPDSLIGCFNYYVDGTDSAWVVLILKKGGNIISMNINNITGSSGGNFIHLKFPVQYNTNDTPDSLVLFFSSGSINQRTHSPASWLIADDIHFSGTSLNITNNSFEQWHSDIGLGLPGWKYEGKGMIPIDTNAVAVMKTTDAVSNQFAAKLKTFSQGGRLRGGSLQTGNDVMDKIPVNARHHSLTGYYKYFPHNNDTMNICVYMYRNGVWIGSGTFYQKNTVRSYEPFTAEIIYFTPDVPDSATINIRTYNLFSPRGNSALYIDKLNFDGFFTGIKETPLPAIGNIDFSVYPNPFSEKATVSFLLNKEEIIMVRLFDISGKQVALLTDGCYKPGEYNINLPVTGLNKGFYICVMNTGDQILSRKVIVY